MLKPCCNANSVCAVRGDMTWRCVNERNIDLDTTSTLQCEVQNAQKAQKARRCPVCKKCAKQARPIPRPPPVSPPPVSGRALCDDQRISRAITETNELRSTVGAGALDCDEKASRIAREWSVKQCGAGTLSHDGFGARCKEASFGACAENVLYNFDTGPDAAVKAVLQWRDSPRHYANLMNVAYSVVGYGYHECGDGRVYWTGIYGRA